LAISKPGMRPAPDPSAGIANADAELKAALAIARKPRP
jgi:hypothetical protein